MIQINKTEIKPYVNSFNAVIKHNTTLPILSTIKMDFTGELLILTGTDLERTLVKTISFKTEEQQSFCIEYKDLNEFLDNVPFDLIEMEIGDNKIIFSYGFDESFSMSFISADEFPSIPEIKNKSDKVEMNVSAMYKNLQQAKYYTSTDQLRPVMCGIFVEIKKGATTITATDAHRLRTSTNENTFEGESFDFIIPTSCISNLSSFRNASFINDENNIVFQDEKTTLYIRKIEGKYPNYRNVIPGKNDEEDPYFVVNTDKLVQALKMVKLGVDKSINQIIISYGTEYLTIKSKNIDLRKEVISKIKLEQSNPGNTFALNIENLKTIINSWKERDDSELIKMYTATSKACIAGDISDELLLLMPILIS